MFLGGKRLGQTWSFDLLIAVVIFIVVVGVFYAFLSNNENRTDPESLQEDAKTIAQLLNCDVVENDFCVIRDGEIIQTRLEDLADMNATELANRGITGTYCIYLVDGDGNIVPVDVGTNQAGIGSEDFELSPGLACNGTI